MKEKNINYGLLIFIGIIIILFIPIIFDYIKNQNIEVLSSSEINTYIEDEKTFLVYIGDVEKSVKKDLRKMRDFTKTDYSYEYGVYSVKRSDTIADIFGNDVVVALVIEGDIQKTYTKYDKDSLNSDVEKYFLGNISEDNKSYKIAENFVAYKKIVKSDEAAVTVFGRDTCFYCNKFKPVYNAVAEKYGVDFYYFNSDDYDKAEYAKVLNLNLVVPAKCSSEGTEFKLSEGFGTPLTIITKKGKIIDCISGYVNRSSLMEKLKSNKIVSE